MPSTLNVSFWPISAFRHRQQWGVFSPSQQSAIGRSLSVVTAAPVESVGCGYLKDVLARLPTQKTGERLEPYTEVPHIRICAGVGR